MGHMVKEHTRKGLGLLALFLAVLCWIAFGKDLIPDPMMVWEDTREMRTVLLTIGGLFVYTYVQWDLGRLRGNVRS
jgi:hypothetical protein